MTTVRPEIRRPWRRRITTVVWGLMVVGVGALAVIELQGYNVDLQLALIAALVVLGGWLVLSAAMPSGRPRLTVTSSDGAATAAPDSSSAGRDKP